jgi:hypothetical protein
MSEAWQEVREDIASTVKNQEAATCAACNKDRSGLWTVRKWKLTDKYLEEKEHLLRCQNCGTVYCGTCYTRIPAQGLLRKQRKCPNCAEQLTDQFLDIFVPDPDVSCRMRIEELSTAYETDERVVHLDARVTTISKLKKLVEPDSMYEDKYSDLGERGKVECHFHNTAVKVGEGWYLLTALPDG